MAEPLLVPFGVEVSATTFAPKLAFPPTSPVGLPKGHPAIHYTPEVLESIRSLCAASFVQDGAGAPILGLLYGTVSDEEMAISAWVPAGELRSHNDAEYTLKLQRRLASRRPETEGLTCLGWVRTRNHGEPRLVQEDQDLHDRCFDDSWQTVMIVRPSFQRPTKAAFYQREANGLFRSDRPVQEFFLYPAHPGDIELPGTIPEPPAGPMVVQIAEPKLPDQIPVPLPSIQELELLPRGTFRAFSPWIAGMLVIVGLLAGSGIAAVRQARDARQHQFGTQDPLRVVAEEGRWAIRWNPRLADLDGASGAVLSVTRDGHLKQITLPLNALRLGVAYIDWVSDDMDVALRVDRPGYAETEQRIRIVGSQKTHAR